MTDTYAEPKFKAPWHQLRQKISGSVKTDEISRTLYASTASIVEVWPSCVVEPRDNDDVAACITFAAKHSIPVTCRGAGSGVVGQSLGQGIILDFSVHMNQVLETDPSERWVRVQPGVIKDDLDAHLGSFDMFWPPDPSSSPWCNVGAMVANNSGGAKSIRWGTSKDYLLELDVLLMSGERVTLRPIPISKSGELDFADDATEAERELASNTLTLIRNHEDVIEQDRPESTRSSSGYNVFELLHEDFSNADWQATCPRITGPSNVGNGAAGVLDMPRLFSGSEGTLGVLLEAKLRVLNLPRKQAGVTLSFTSNEKMAEGVVALLETAPTKLEVLDRSFIDVAAKSDPKLAEGIPDELASLIIAEYWANDEKACREGVDAAIKATTGKGGPAFDHKPAYDIDELNDAWKIRKVASPILSRVKGDLKPTRWIEDCAVPPWKLPDFIAGFREICERLGFRAHLFGHAGEGNLHVNPFANAKLASHRDRMRQAAEEVFALVKSLKGTMSGEHGDGIMRSPYLKTMYPHTFELFREIKNLFDPDRLLNPLTKIVDDDQRDITSFLRVGKDYERQPTGTALDKPEVLEEIEKCHGCGKCRVYCPLMRVGSEEKYSARAKANLLRGVISGRISSDFLTDAEFKDNLDLCIACGQCLVDCPTQVDIPGIAMRFREQYVDRVGGSGVVGDMLAKPDRMGKVGRTVSGLTNSILKNRFLRGVAQTVTGLDERRKLPQFKTSHGVPKLAYLDLPDEVRENLPEEVVVFPGCYAEYYDPDGEKNTLIEIMIALGLTVHSPELNCCGISRITKGDVRGARSELTENVDKLLPLVRDGAKVIFSAPSCMLAAKHEWARIVGTEYAQQVADACTDAHDLLVEVFSHPEVAKQLTPLDDKIAYHEPCHTRVIGVSGKPKDLIDLLNDQKTANLDAGCCGLSGTFGLLKSNFDQSMKIAQPLFNKINREAPDVVTSPCGICQTQIRQGVKTVQDGGEIRIKHPIRILYDALPRR